MCWVRCGETVWSGESGLVVLGSLAVRWGVGGGETILFAVCLVDWMFARLACICPLIVAVWSGGHLRNCLVVMFGKVVRKPACMAFARVVSVGEKSDLWRKVTRSAAVGASIAEFSLCVVGVWVDADAAWSEW